MSKSAHITLLLLLLICSPSAIPAQQTAQEVLAPLTDEERALNLHELIANQPDFGADLEFFVAERKIGGAYGFAYRVVRKGKRFRQQSEFWIFVGEIGKRTARLFPNSRSYDDMEPPRGESTEEGGAARDSLSDSAGIGILSA